MQIFAAITRQDASSQQEYIALYFISFFDHRKGVPFEIFESLRITARCALRVICRFIRGRRCVLIYEAK